MERHQRIDELGFGIRLDTYGFADEELTGAVDRLRRMSRLPGASVSERPAGRDPGGIRDGRGGERASEGPPVLVLAASDPANPYGAALGWPERPSLDEGRRGHQPGRKAGSLVALVDGELVLYVERGGKTMLCWSDDVTALQSAADALALAVREGALGRLTVEKADGAPLLGSDHPLVQALSQAGFHMTPRGLRLRR